jgi:hypothetical protein
MYRLVDVKLYQTLRTAKGGIVTRPLPQNLAPPGEVQGIAIVKVEEQKAAARVDEDVAERVEEEIAAIIREEERAVVLDLYETRATAAV